MKIISLILKKKIIFYILYFTLIFSIFELFLRISLPNLLQGTKKDIYKEHKLYGWTLKKNLVFKYYNPYTREPTLLKTDNNGFRIVESEQLNQNIFFLGDSITAGLGAKGDKIFPALISKNLKSNGFNFGVNGYSTDQSYIILKDYIKKYKPKYVFYTFVNNDLEFNMKNYIPMGNKTLIGKPKLNQNLEVKEKEFFLIKNSNIKQKLSEFVNSNIAIYRFLALIKNYSTLYNRQKTEIFYQNFSFDYNFESQLKKKQIDLFFKILKEMKKLCDENGSEFYLIKAFSLDDSKYASLKIKPDNYKEYKDFNNQISIKSKEKNINYIKIDNVESLSLHNNNFFFNINDVIYDGHYNENGHEFFAKEILKKIHQKNKF